MAEGFIKRLSEINSYSYKHSILLIRTNCVKLQYFKELRMKTSKVVPMIKSHYKTEGKGIFTKVIQLQHTLNNGLHPTTPTVVPLINAKDSSK